MVPIGQVGYSSVGLASFGLASENTWMCVVEFGGAVWGRYRLCIQIVVALCRSIATLSHFVIHPIPVRPAIVLALVVWP